MGWFSTSLSWPRAERSPRQAESLERPKGRAMDCAACEKYRDVPSSKRWSDSACRGEGCRAARGRLFFGYFLLATQKKVPRLRFENRIINSYLTIAPTARSALNTKSWIPAFAGMTMLLG